MSEITTFILIGWVNAMTALAIDFGMKYGHLLGFIRLWRVRLAANANQINNFEQMVEEGKTKPFSDRIDFFNDLYWEVAGYSFWLPIWLCVKCMSYRIFFLVWIGASLWMGLDFFDWFRLLFVGAAANLTTIMVLAGKKTEVNIKHESACHI